MNRRKFFGMTAGALIASGLPLSLLPERKIFLPPRAGWFSTDIRMREVLQYYINNDSEGWAYFAVGRDLFGKDHCYHVYTAYEAPEETRLAIARQLIGDRFEHDGLKPVPIGRSATFPLPLPRHAIGARYV